MIEMVGIRIVEKSYMFVLLYNNILFVLSFLQKEINFFFRIFWYEPRWLEREDYGSVLCNNSIRWSPFCVWMENWIPSKTHTNGSIVIPPVTDRKEEEGGSSER